MKKIKIFSVKTLAFSRSIRYTIKAIEKEVQAIMAKCSCCGKGVTFGIKVSHSHRRSNRYRCYRSNFAQAREGDRRGFPEVYLRLHPLPALW